MSVSPEQEIAEASEAYLTFGGWAKAMPNPPKRGERRRYEVDVECTSGAVKSSEKGERHMRGLSILRVKEITGVVVAPRDEDENQGALFDENAQPKDDADIGYTDMAGADDDAEPSNVTQFKAPGK
jgi:hypothetical protein